MAIIDTAALSVAKRYQLITERSQMTTRVQHQRVDLYALTGNNIPVGLVHSDPGLKNVRILQFSYLSTFFFLLYFFFIKSVQLLRMFSSMDVFTTCGWQSGKYHLQPAEGVKTQMTGESFNTLSYLWI